VAVAAVTIEREAKAEEEKAKENFIYTFHLSLPGP
jgi:hypothetical protein